MEADRGKETMSDRARRREMERLKERKKIHRKKKRRRPKQWRKIKERVSARAVTTPTDRR